MADRPEEMGPETLDRPQRWARPFVTSLLVVFASCGLLGIEAWPLSGFRLFSAPRDERSVAWRLVAVTGDGEQVPVNVSKLGSAYRGFGFVARTFDELSSAERAQLCVVWARAARANGIDVAGFHIVRIEQRLLPRDGDGPREGPRAHAVAACEVAR
jgi:uncharacterized protein YqfA (UPF0365 family)